MIRQILSKSTLNGVKKDVAIGESATKINSYAEQRHFTYHNEFMSKLLTPRARRKKRNSGPT